MFLTRIGVRRLTVKPLASCVFGCSRSYAFLSTRRAKPGSAWGSVSTATDKSSVWSSDAAAESRIDEQDTLENVFSEPVSVNQLEAPLRFEGSWTRNLGLDAQEFPYTRLDFVVSLKQDPETAVVQGVTLALEKKGVSASVPVRSLGTLTALSRKRAFSADVENLTALHIDVLNDELNQLIHRPTHGKLILQLKGNGASESSCDEDTTGLIGFEEK